MGLINGSTKDDCFRNFRVFEAQRIPRALGSVSAILLSLEEPEIDDIGPSPSWTADLDLPPLLLDKWCILLDIKDTYSSTVETRESETGHENVVCLCSYDQNLQFGSLNTSFRVFKPKLGNSSPTLSKGHQQPCIVSQNIFKCIKDDCHGREIWLEISGGRCNVVRFFGNQESCMVKVRSNLDVITRWLSLIHI